MSEAAQDQNIEAIAKIISMTRDGRFEWQIASPDTLMGSYDSDSRFSSIFICRYDDKWLRVFRRSYDVSILKNARLGALAIAASLGETRTERRVEVVLEIVDRNKNSLWQFPREEMLDDLLKVVRYKASGAGELISKLLNEP